MAAILSDREAPPLSRYSSDVPAELERIVAKALRKNREERYQTIKDLLLDLQSLRQRLEFERTHPPRPVGTTQPSASAAPVPPDAISWLAIVCGLLVLVGGAIGYGWWKQAHAPRQPEIRSLAVLPLKPLDAGRQLPRARNCGCGDSQTQSNRQAHRAPDECGPPISQRGHRRAHRGETAGSRFGARRVVSARGRPPASERQSPAMSGRRVVVVGQF